jgi:RNA polymerase sigma-70 factor (ECF subfamily)
MRPALCEAALRLGRVLAELVPDEPEVHGLIALMELQASRMKARVDPNGDPVLLLAQDRARWDRVLIGRGLAALDRGDALVARGPRSERTCCRRGSRRVMRARAHLRIPIGPKSRRSMRR